MTGVRDLPPFLLLSAVLHVALLMLLPAPNLFRDESELIIVARIQPGELALRRAEEALDAVAGLEIPPPDLEAPRPEPTPKIEPEPVPEPTPKPEPVPAPPPTEPEPLAPKPPTPPPAVEPTPPPVTAVAPPPMAEPSPPPAPPEPEVPPVDLSRRLPVRAVDVALPRARTPTNEVLALAPAATPRRGPEHRPDPASPPPSVADEAARRATQKESRAVLDSLGSQPDASLPMVLAALRRDRTAPPAAAMPGDRDAASTPFELFSPIEGPVHDRKLQWRPPPPEITVYRDADIRLRFDVRPDGSVTRVIPVIKADARLEQAATAYLLAWRFSPVDPEEFDPASSWGEITFHFRLR
ncbi:MAG: TonB family protein [Myxococcales bacterium]|nr:TonB family protein [Myxococcales bacterium]